MATPNTVLGFVGAGMMASALIRGISKAGVVPASRIVGFDPMKAGRDQLEKLGATAVESGVAVVEKSNVIFLAVKPHIIPVVLKEINPNVTSDKLIVSIAAGVTLAAIEQQLAPGTRVIRVMPNTPCSVGESASGFVAGTNATAEDVELVNSLLSAVGEAVKITENQINALTAVSGSGPAYMFLLIEALADGGVRQGLPRPLALKLAAQTARGAATMVLESGRHPGELKDGVCSPGGTTIAGVEALEKGNFRATAMAAVAAAKARADELSKY